VSSTGSQLTPTDKVVQPCSGCDRLVVDGAQDDGTYGQEDPGSFFFTTDGNLVETTLDTIYSTQPLTIDVPLLGGQK
jgi:hypothetical protein